MLAVVLAALQVLAPVPPSALHHANGRFVRMKTAAATGSVDWDALKRTVILRGHAGQDPEVSFERIMPVEFRPTAVAGLEPGRLAVAGRDGLRVCIELWRVEDATEGPGPRIGEPTFDVVERHRVWEEIEADSIGLLLWNPIPPAGARTSLRAIWHQRRELSRFDVDAAGWATAALEAAMRGPTERHVLHVPELEHPLTATLQAEHPERGLVLMLQSPCPVPLGWCEGPELSLALLDGDLDGRLDGARNLTGPIWTQEDWGSIYSDSRLFR